MLNIASIYRFNTPFLDILKEKVALISVIKKIEKSVKFDWLWFHFENKVEWNYNHLRFVLNDNLWYINLYYIIDIDTNIYHLPIFKLDIVINELFLLDNEHRQWAVKFLNNIFECFDWLTEKEFLIDINNTLYYTTGIFKTKIYPSYDFSDIEKIRESFESSDWITLVEDFINKFSDTTFELSIEKSDYYYKLYSIFLYFIYLVYVMYENIEKTNQTQTELEQNYDNEVFETHKQLIKNRLEYVNNIHNNTFEQYKNRLELFFKMF